MVISGYLDRKIDWPTKQEFVRRGYGEEGLELGRERISLTKRAFHYPVSRCTILS
jgi:hypothetical protein